MKQPEPSGPPPSVVGPLSLQSEPLRLRLIFDSSRGIEAALLVTLLELIDAALRETEISKLERARSELADLPSVVVDAAIERVRRTRHQALRFTDAKPGSIEIGLALVIVGTWLLRNTIGESVKEGYKVSDLNRRLTAFAKRSFDAMAGAMTELGQRIAFQASGKSIRVLVSEVIRRDQHVEALELRVPAEGMPPQIPTYGEADFL